MSRIKKPQSKNLRRMHLDTTRCNDSAHGIVDRRLPANVSLRHFWLRGSVMKTVLILVALGVVAFVTVLALLRGKSRGSARPLAELEWPYFAMTPLSRVEQVVFYQLVKALPEHVILAQVQVSRVLGVKRGRPALEWANRINRMSYDFVVCTRDFTVVAAIELDDRSHEREDRIDADARKDKATASAGVPLIRWHVRSLPDVDTIQRDVLAVRERALKG
jgi:hypothetical protein